MDAFLASHEPVIRLGGFFGVFALMAAWEQYAPCRPLTVPRRLRWTTNLVLAGLNTLLVRAILPVTAAGVAVWAGQRQWGLVHWLGLSQPLAVGLSILALDFVIWGQHRMVHAVPLLWRVHRVHHADLDYDVTTGARFHPFEILLSMTIKLAAVALLGAPVVAVIAFEVLLNATAMFNHGNVRLPGAVDRAVRRVLVTPDMHRVHHSLASDESNTNFGFNLSWWDRLFGTYRAAPRGGQAGVAFGIADHSTVDEVERLPGVLVLPFRREGDGRKRTTAPTGDAVQGLPR